MRDLDLALLGDVLLRGSLLLLLAGVASALLRSAAHRHLTWCLGIGAQIVLPVLLLLGPELHFNLPRWTVAPSGAGAPARAVPAETGDPPSTSVSLDQAGPAPVVLHGGGDSAPPTVGAARGLGRWALALAWASGTALLLLSLLRATMQRGRLLRNAAPAETTRWRRLLTLAAGRLGMEKPPRLFVGSSGSMPTTWGTWRPVVMLPQEALEWPTGLCRDVLVHELAHVRRRDHLSQRLAFLVRALLWPNPLVWWASQRLAAESERACDDLVLGSGTRPSRYAEHLLDAAQALHLKAKDLCHPAPGLGMAGGSQLASRIASILDQARCRTPMDRGRLIVATALAVVIVLPVAAAAPVFSAPPAPPKAPTTAPAPSVPAGPPHSSGSPSPAPPTTPSTALPAEAIPGVDPAPRAEPMPLPSPPPSQIDRTPPTISFPPSLAPVNIPVSRSDLPSATELFPPVAPTTPSSGASETSDTSPPPAPATPDPTPPPQVVAVPRGWFSPNFVFQQGGSPVAELKASRWTSKARLTVGESVFDLYRERRLGGDFVLASGDSILARARKPGVMGSAYSLDWEDATYVLHPRSMAKRAFILVDGEHELGAVKRESWHSRRSQLSLPADWPLEIQVFAFWLSELSWQDDEDQNAVLRLVTAGAVSR